MLTFEAQPFQGAAFIVEKLSVRGSLWKERSRACSIKVTDISVPAQNLPFQKVQHRVDTTDAQPSGEHGGIVVMVTGALMVRRPILAALHCTASALSLLEPR